MAERAVYVPELQLLHAIRGALRVERESERPLILAGVSDWLARTGHTMPRMTAAINLDETT
jgi:hypothetical protein